MFDEERGGRKANIAFRMRAHRSWRSRVAESWSLFVCVQTTAVPRPIFRVRVLVASIRIEEITANASATATVELGFRRERTATNRQDEAQNATGESILHAFSFSLFFLCISLAHKRLFLAHLAVIPSVVKSVSLGRPSCDLLSKISSLRHDS